MEMNKYSGRNLIKNYRSQGYSFLNGEGTDTEAFFGFHFISKAVNAPSHPKYYIDFLDYDPKY